MTDAPLPQGWPCREGNPLLPLHCERRAEADEPAHGGRSVLLSPLHRAARLGIARCPTEGCLSIPLNKAFQSLCCGDSCGTAQERGPKPSYHPVPHFHPRVIKPSAGQAGTGAEAAGPCEICSITPLRNGAREWEGKEGGGGFLGIGGSIHQLTQVKVTTDVGGMSRAGGGRGSARTGHSGGLVCHSQLFGWTCLSRSY